MFIQKSFKDSNWKKKITHEMRAVPRYVWWIVWWCGTPWILGYRTICLKCLFIFRLELLSAQPLNLSKNYLSEFAWIGNRIWVILPVLGLGSALSAYNFDLGFLEFDFGIPYLGSNGLPHYGHWMWLKFLWGCWWKWNLFFVLWLSVR